jgi:hypothetical protein
MTTDRKEQLTGNEATILNSCRGQLSAFADKLRVLATEADDALAAMDAQLEDFDVDHPERTRMTTSQRRDAEERVAERS